MRGRLPFIVIVLFLSVLGILLYRRVIELPVEVARTTHVLFNCAEAVVWASAGVCVVWRFRAQRPALRRLGAVASAAFLAFGVSDLVEAQTGTWYHPWWLLAWKTACILVLLFCLLAYARIRQGERR